jgi:hypothetical protein
VFPQIPQKGIRGGVASLIQLLGTDQDSLEVYFLFSPNYGKDFNERFLVLIDHTEWGVYDFPKGGILKLRHHAP